MNKTSWLIIWISTGVALIIGIFMLWPGLSRDWQTLKETNTAKKELEELSQKKQALTELSKNTELDKISQTAAGYIPETVKSSELVLELTAMVNESGMSVEQISLDSQTAAQIAEEDSPVTDAKKTAESQTASAKAVPFSLKIAGNFQQMMQFFKLAETSSRLIKIEKLGLAQEKEEFVASLEGTAYWKENQAASLTKSLADITVSQETLKKFANLRQYATPIDTTAEDGFGRTDPFENIK